MPKRQAHNAASYARLLALAQRLHLECLERNIQEHPDHLAALARARFLERCLEVLLPDDVPDMLLPRTEFEMMNLLDRRELA